MGLCQQRGKGWQQLLDDLPVEPRRRVGAGAPLDQQLHVVGPGHALEDAGRAHDRNPPRLSCGVDGPVHPRRVHPRIVDQDHRDAGRAAGVDHGLQVASGTPRGLLVRHDALHRRHPRSRPWPRRVRTAGPAVARAGPGSSPRAAHPLPGVCESPAQRICSAASLEAASPLRSGRATRAAIWSDTSSSSRPARKIAAPWARRLHTPSAYASRARGRRRSSPLSAPRAGARARPPRARPCAAIAPTRRGRCATPNRS